METAVFVDACGLIYNYNDINIWLYKSTTIYNYNFYMGEQFQIYQDLITYRCDIQN